MDFRKILYIVIAILLIYFLYKWIFYKTETLLVDTHDAKIAQIINPTEFNGENSVSDYTYSLWFYVKDWNHNFGNKKQIFARYNNVNNTNFPVPEVYLAPSVNNLIVDMNCAPNMGSDINTSNITSCAIQNIPLQRWTHLLVSLNGRALDIYLDGKLVKTCVLNGVPNIASSPMSLCKDGGFSGYIAKFKHYNKSMNPTEAYNIYKEGISGNPLFDALNKYSLKMSVIENNREVKSFKI